MRALLCTLGVLITLLVAGPMLAVGGDNKEPAKKDAKAAADQKKDPLADLKLDLKDDKTDKKDAKTDPKDTKPEKKEKFVWGGEFIGKIKQMDANSQKDLTIEISWQTQEPNQGNMNAYRD